MALFGYYARGDNRIDSEIDILNDFNGSIGMKFFTLFHELEDAFDMKVDLVARKGIKPHYLPYVEKSLISI
ncbi:nucleotidyltransferase domain-containing protein [Pedobacter sp. L105]|uniref:nucleotidyltransferase family protein n=1 Tax=Pedobacter sp. L105 TaxID=1641871 RepID=UPI0020B17152